MWSECSRYTTKGWKSSKAHLALRAHDKTTRFRPRNQLGLPFVNVLDTTRDLFGPGRLGILVNGFVQALQEESGHRCSCLARQPQRFIKQPFLGTVHAGIVP